MYCVYLTIMRFRQLFTMVDPGNQTQTDLDKIAGQLETRSTGSCTQQDASCVEGASWLFRIPFWLEVNFIFLRTSHFFSLSSSSGLPTSFHYHHLFTSTAAIHGSTNSSARCEWNRIEQNEGLFIQYTTHWDATTTQTPLSSPRHYKCSHRKYNPRCKVEHFL